MKMLERLTDDMHMNTLSRSFDAIANIPENMKQ